MKSPWLIALCCILLVACSNTPNAPTSSEEAPQRPANASDYQQDLIYPRETTNFVADGELVVYDDPFYGAAISYVDARDYPDIITVFVYPIAATSWENTEFILNNEVDTFLTELDNTVEAGIYQAVGPRTRSDYTFTQDGLTYRGKKVHFEFTNQQGIEFNADAYIFIQKDKYIKFRTSSYKAFTPDWNGDLIVNELLPEITVPDESKFMRKLRNQQRRQ